MVLPRVSRVGTGINRIRRHHGVFKLLGLAYRGWSFALAAGDQSRHLLRDWLDIWSHRVLHPFAILQEMGVRIPWIVTVPAGADAHAAGH